MYRKFSADYIFNGQHLLDPGNVLITTSEGRVVDVVPLPEAGDGIQVLNGLLCPGFINAHCHLELSHLKGKIPEQTGLVDFILPLMRDRGADRVLIQSAIADAEATMLEAGIVAVGDICNTADTLSRKRAGKLRYHNFLEASGFVPAGAAARFNSMLQLYHQFRELQPATSLVPHAPYSVCQALLEMIDELACPVTTFHNQEVPAENEFFQTGTGELLRLYRELNIDISFFHPPGIRSLAAFLPSLSRFESLILVHNVCTGREELEGLANGVDQSLIVNDKSSLNFEQSSFNTSLISLCLCPNANLYISGLLPDIPLLLQSGLNIVLGTDSLASNHQLSVLEEMKTLQRHFPALETARLLQWATINGARALQMDSQLGSFETGKQPGVVLISNIADGCFTPLSDAERVL